MNVELDPAKEWKRVVVTAQRFGKKHGRWPTRIVLPDAVHDALSTAFPPEDWASLEKEVEIRSGAARTRAEDSEGDSYISGESLATRLTFTVKDAEPPWFALALDSDEAGAPVDELTLALRRLGYEEEEEDADPITSIERAVARAGSAAVIRIRETESPQQPGEVTSELRALLAVPQVREVMSAQGFRRIQMAILRVYAAEFVAYFGVKAKADEAAWAEMDRRATALSEALTNRPLSDTVLRALAAAPPTQDAAAEDFAELAEWAAALATDERHLTQDSA